MGSHYAYKNLGRLIEAFAQTSLLETKLLIAGVPDPRYTPLLQAQTQALGLGDRVEFLAYVPYDDLPRLINQAIALVFPSLWEGFGLPVLEAMACGTPVITSNRSALPEVAGDAALLIDPYQVGALADAMGSVANDYAFGTLFTRPGSRGLAGLAGRKRGVGRGRFCSGICSICRGSRMQNSKFKIQNPKPESKIRNPESKILPVAGSNNPIANGKGQDRQRQPN